MIRQTIVRFSIPFREAMAALLADDQVDAESYEIRVIDGCVVIDLLNPSVGEPVPPRSEIAPDPTAAEIVAMERGPDCDESEEAGEVEDEVDVGGEDQLEDDGEPDEVAEKNAERKAAVENGQDEMFYSSEKAPESAKGERGEKKEAKPASGPRAQRAGILCNEGAFQRFMQEEGDAEGCAKAVRYTCGVKSRRDLDTDETAGREWDSLMREYDAWMRS